MYLWDDTTCNLALASGIADYSTVKTAEFLSVLKLSVVVYLKFSPNFCG